ncbi:hypothetical protein [Streptomyces sp. NPDC126514]|uniref:hypothetical protein n=1 Tax=Streptomyces sp. NPDC126514 TaxID=3155210 RepID=UPI00332DA989
MTALTAIVTPRDRPTLRPGGPPRAVLRPHRTAPALRGLTLLTAPHRTGATA